MAEAASESGCSRRIGRGPTNHYGAPRLRLEMCSMKGAQEHILPLKPVSA